MNRRIMNSIIGQVEAKQIDNKIKTGQPIVSVKEIKIDKLKSKQKKKTFLTGVVVTGIVGIVLFKIFKR